MLGMSCAKAGEYYPVRKSERVHLFDKLALDTLAVVEHHVTHEHQPGLGVFRRHDAERLQQQVKPFPSLQPAHRAYQEAVVGEPQLRPAGAPGRRVRVEQPEYPPRCG